MTVRGPWGKIDKKWMREEIVRRGFDPDAPAPAATCIYCRELILDAGTILEPRKFCSETCEQRAGTVVEGEEHSCSNCGKAFSERWIWRREREALCLDCCIAINPGWWVPIAPGSAYAGRGQR